MKSLYEINHRDIPDTLILSLDFDGCSVAWNSDEDFDASQIKMGPAIFGIS